MPRNLNERVELMTPVEFAPHKEQIKHILKLYFDDNVKAYAMNQDGSYRYLPMNGRVKRLTPRIRASAKRKSCQRTASVKCGSCAISSFARVRRIRRNRKTTKLTMPAAFAKW